MTKVFFLRSTVYFFAFSYLLTMFLSCNSALYTSSSGVQYNEETSFFPDVADIFVPEAIPNAIRLRNFISSNYFHEYKKKHNDINSLSEIYNYALWITDKNIAQSLFLISISTLPYKRSPAKIPLLNFDMMFYFSLESDSAFHKRYVNLPSKLFADSPRNSFGDKDKIPHFFGAAYLAYITDDKYFPRTVGELIEIGESIFQLDGFMDIRDKRANEWGIKFGRALLLNPEEKPENYLGFNLK